jgi:hypothetical protein
MVATVKTGVMVMVLVLVPEPVLGAAVSAEVPHSLCEEPRFERGDFWKDLQSQLHRFRGSLWSPFCGFSSLFCGFSPSFLFSHSLLWFSPFVS